LVFFVERHCVERSCCSQQFQFILEELINLGCRFINPSRINKYKINILVRLNNLCSLFRNVKDLFVYSWQNASSERWRCEENWLEPSTTAAWQVSVKMIHARILYKSGAAVCWMLVCEDILWKIFVRQLLYWNTQSVIFLVICMKYNSTVSIPEYVNWRHTF